MDVRCCCSACSTQFTVDAKFAGRKAKCPKCATVVVVPSVTADETSARPGAEEVATFPAVAQPAPAKAERVPEVPTFPAIAQPKPAVSSAVEQPKPAASSAIESVAVFPVADARTPAAAPPRKSKPSDSAVVGNSGVLSGSGVLLEIESSAVPAAGLPAIDVPASESSINRRPSAAAKRRGPRKKIPKLWWIVGGACAAMVLVGIIGAAMLSNGGAMSRPTTLIFDWPASERTDASLLINDETYRVPASGEMAFELKPGDHRVLLRRRGYDQIEVVVSLGQGERRQLKPEWKQSLLAQVAPGGGFPGGIGLPSNVGLPNSAPTFSPDYQGWLQNFDEAKAAAAQQNKDIFIAFVALQGSSGSRRLQDEVFYSGDFRSLAQSQFVLVMIDLPINEQGYNQLEDPAHNAWMRKQFSVHTIPTVVICDAQGLPYAIQERYLGNAEQYVALLKKLAASKQERDQILAQVQTASGDARLAAALSAVKWLQQRDVLHFYGAEIRQWTALGRQFDPQNDKGQYEVLFEADWLVKLYEARDQSPQQLAKIAVALGQWKQGKSFRDADRAGRLHLIAAALLMEADNRDLAATYVDEGLAYNPTDQDLRGQLQEAAGLISGETGSGTGFVVADGYVLTNHHVIEGPGKVTVRLPGTAEKISAEVVVRNSQRDMALLRVNLPSGTTLKPLSISAAEVRRGASVAAFGYPLGDDFGAGLKLTTGVVSGLPDPSNDQMMLLDCRINPGNSGGPLCNAYGAVIGMVTAKSVGGIGVDSYGMALPAEDLIEFVRQHVPGYKPPADTGQDVLGWDEVDQLVSPSVLTVFKYER